MTENIQSQVQEYRANYATTLLRTAWGKAGTRFHDIPVTLVDRFNDTMRMVHNARSSIALMRELFLGHPDMDLATWGHFGRTYCHLSRAKLSLNPIT